MANKIIARNKNWLIIERPNAGLDGWMNVWVSERRPDVSRADFLLSYNKRTRRFNDCPAWKRMMTAYPEVGVWAVNAIKDRYSFKGD